MSKVPVFVGTTRRLLPVLDDVCLTKLTAED